MNFRLCPILIDLIISHIYDWVLLVIQRCFNGFYRFLGAFVHHSHTLYVWLKISTVSESTLVTNTNALPNFNLTMNSRRVWKLSEFIPLTNGYISIVIHVNMISESPVGFCVVFMEEYRYLWLLMTLYFRQWACKHIQPKKTQFIYLLYYITIYIQFPCHSLLYTLRYCPAKLRRNGTIRRLLTIQASWANLLTTKLFLTVQIIWQLAESFGVSYILVYLELKSNTSSFSVLREIELIEYLCDILGKIKAINCSS